jgi:GTP-binding protein
MIVDDAIIYLKAGNGGEGATGMLMYSARRVIGAGGNGGEGGDVIIKVSPHLYDLNKFREHKKFTAENGVRGKDKNRKGRSGENCIVNVPAGTLVFDDEENLLIDLIADNQEYLACKGGEGGEGNFKKQYTLPAQPGEEKEVILDYRIPNDVAILGFANSGKTSLFNILTGQNHKVAAYPHTTVSCGLGTVEFDFKRFSVLDTPALKKDTPDYQVLHRFLKHIWRSKILLLLSENATDFLKEFASIKKEIKRVDPALLEEKKIFYLLTKVDTIEDKEAPLKGVFKISIPESMGIEKLKMKIVTHLAKDRI